MPKISQDMALRRNIVSEIQIMAQQLGIGNSRHSK